ncbi:hypothetical protein AB6878_15190 [Carnobacterium maltaromaticum]|nr:hypothetical protein [Carnobacterium maltaromaticum]
MKIEELYVEITKEEAEKVIGGSWWNPNSNFWTALYNATRGY